MVILKSDPVIGHTPLSLSCIALIADWTLIGHCCNPSYCILTQKCRLCKDNRLYKKRLQGGYGSQSSSVSLHKTDICFNYVVSQKNQFCQNFCILHIKPTTKYTTNCLQQFYLLLISPYNKADDREPEDFTKIGTQQPYQELRPLPEQIICIQIYCISSPTLCHTSRTH